MVVSAAGGVKRRRASAAGSVRVSSGAGSKSSRSSTGGSTSSAPADQTSSAAKNNPLYDEFIQLLSDPRYKGKGIANSALKSHFGDDRYPRLVPVINELNRASRLTMSKGASRTGVPGETSEVYFSLLSAEEATKLQGLDASSKMVYQVIETSGNKGIWTVDVRNQTNIQQATLTKIFKQLHSFCFG